MQTDLRGRDYISDMDFSKEEIETVIDVALKLKRDRALGIGHPTLRDFALDLVAVREDSAGEGHVIDDVSCRKWRFSGRSATLDAPGTQSVSAIRALSQDLHAGGSLRGPRAFTSRGDV